MKNRTTLPTALILSLVSPALFAANFVVSTTGSDSNPGSELEPFATLERARDAVRQLKTAGPLQPGGTTIEVRGGVYPLAQPLQFTDQDSGTETAPIVYQARTGEVVRFTGGRRVSGWSPVNDPSVQARLDAGRGTMFTRPTSRHSALRTCKASGMPASINRTRVSNCSSRTSR